MSRRAPAPTTTIEQQLRAAGFTCVVGFDEVGKGAWAGPLMIGAAVLRADVLDLDQPAAFMGGARDSKQIAESQRDAVFEVVARTTAAWSVGCASAQECDALGMNAAQQLATRRALDQLGIQPDAAIVDGKWDFVAPHISRVVAKVKADATCLSVAAASIVAKVTRDRLMRHWAENFPHWHFDTNKGYPCPKHRIALQGYGPSAIHRTSWAFMPNHVPWLHVEVPVPATRVRQSPPEHWGG
ncbi:MAG: ribonuclease HII [Ilumatobacteraceae bacterium]